MVVNEGPNRGMGLPTSDSRSSRWRSSDATSERRRSRTESIGVRALKEGKRKRDQIFG